MNRPDSSDGLEELTARMGGLCWVSEQLFRIEGGWAAEMTDPAAVVHLGTSSRHHGWHATLWRDALPDSGALDARAAVQAPGRGWAAAVGVADGIGERGPAADVARLVCLYRGLVPRAWSLLADFEDRLSGLGMGHLARVVRLVAPDLAADAQRGHRLLEATLRDEAALDKASSVVRILDEAFQT